MPNQRAPGVRMRCVPLHDDLWREVRAAATRRGTNLSEVVRAALERFVREDDSDA